MTTVIRSVAARATCIAITSHGSPLRYWYSPTAAWQPSRMTATIESRCAGEPRNRFQSQTDRAARSTVNVVATRTCTQAAS